MKFGIMYNTAYHGTDPGNIAAIARHAEASGFESFYVPEHIVLYPGATGAGVEFPPSLAIADPLWAGDDKGVSYSGEFYRRIAIVPAGAQHDGPGAPRSCVHRAVRPAIKGQQKGNFPSRFPRWSNRANTDRPGRGLHWEDPCAPRPLIGPAC